MILLQCIELIGLGFIAYVMYGLVVKRRSVKQVWDHYFNKARKGKLRD